MIRRRPRCCAASLISDGAPLSLFAVKSEEESLLLAQLMVAAGHQAGRKTLAVMTNNDQPIGRAVGNYVELVEAAAVLEGKGPDDVRELVRAQCAMMLQLGGGRGSLSGALAECDGSLANGKGMEVLAQMVKNSRPHALGRGHSQTLRSGAESGIDVPLLFSHRF